MNVSGGMFMLSLRTWFVGVYLLTITFSSVAFAGFETGFNQGWIYNRYGTQWVDGFDINEFRRTMRLTKQANGQIVRYWLFEGYVSQSLLFSDSSFVGLNPKFVQNLKLVMKVAKEEGVKLNLTMFDGNMGTFTAPNQNAKNIAWNLWNDKYQVRQDFINKVYIPLVDLITQSPYASVVTQFDIANEINALVRSASDVRFEGGWPQANQFICQLYQIKKDRAAPFAYTASLGWGDAVRNVLTGTLQPQCVDFFDIHIYDSGGDIESCEAVVQYARRYGKKIYLGEFGQSNFWKAYSDSTQTTATRNFLYNAHRCGFDGAMAWRLVENEPDAFLAYEKNGVLRPAYWEFQKISAQLQ